jgi:hypothetical protein
MQHAETEPPAKRREPARGTPATMRGASPAAPDVQAGQAVRALAAPDRLTAPLARAVAARAEIPSKGERLLQRASLGQTGWLPGLKYENRTRTLVADGRPGKVYSETVRQVAASKAEALQVAAKRNAIVGKTVDDKAASVWGYADKSRQWTFGTENLNKPAFPAIDPFHFEVVVPFKSATDKPDMLRLRFQHASSFTGYVESISDTSNPATSASPAMYDFKLESPLKNTVVGGRNLQFSNRHAKGGTTNLLAETGGSSEHSLDAYTKIAGEGARWQCVRAHAAKLQDNSYFFVTNVDGLYGITFRDLWLNWLTVFNKTYDVPDADVSAAIRAGKFGDARTNLLGVAEKDYDLDAGCSYAHRFQCFHAHAGKMEGDSYYFGTFEPGIYGLKFADLCVKWWTVFGKEDDIPDSRVVEAINNNELQDVEVKLDWVAEKDYDLDAGRSWEPPEVVEQPPPEVVTPTTPEVVTSPTPEVLTPPEPMSKSAKNRERAKKRKEKWKG